MINSKRISATKGKEFVVFLIGMRVNKWWKIGSISQVGMAMGRMLKELYSKPESGFLGAESWFGRTTIMVQYWESFEKLEAYAKDRDQEHYPAWIDYYKKIKQSREAVGIWHETYIQSPGTYESVYANMPAFGLGKVIGTEDATADYQTAKQRIAS
jgi:hypothetical protein